MTAIEWPAMPAHTWTSPARPVRAIDGDTLVVLVDQGRRQYEILTLRLHGINCPELGTPEGDAARTFADQWLGCDGAEPIELTEWPLLVQTLKPDKYGDRWLAYVWRAADGALLNRVLVEAGWAKEWDGRGPKP